MTLRIIIVFITVSLFSTSCLRGKGTNDRLIKGVNPASRVERFEYGAYSDTIYALIYGQVYEIQKAANHQDTLVPLSDVAIRVEQDNKSAVTNGNGEFEIGLEKGLFSLVVSKEGYEPLQIINYVSDPDQVSSTKIILAKGKDQRTFEVPKWTR